MAHSYLTEKMQQALAASRNNRQAAQKLIMKWARTDTLLLAALAGPFMPGLINHAFEQITPQKNTQNIDKKQTSINQKARLGGKAARMQAPPDITDLLAAHLEQTTGTHHGPYSRGRPVASKRHEQAIKQIYKAQWHNRFDKLQKDNAAN